jgi:hypothetical protein
MTYCTLLLDDVLRDYRWKNVLNKPEHILYEKETCFVEVIITNPTSIQVSIPVKNTAFQYRTSFSSMEDAVSYIEDRVTDYEEEDFILY